MSTFEMRSLDGEVQWLAVCDTCSAVVSSESDHAKWHAKLTMENVGPDVLDLPMDDYDSGAHSIREYLTKLLLMLWRERDGFSGKRPFGNSNWDWDLYLPLVQASLVSGEITAEGDLVGFDEAAADAAIESAIKALGGLK